MRQCSGVSVLDVPQYTIANSKFHVTLLPPLHAVLCVASHHRLSTLAYVCAICAFILRCSKNKLDDTTAAAGNKNLTQQNRGGKNNKRRHKNGGRVSDDGGGIGISYVYVYVYEMSETHLI